MAKEKKERADKYQEKVKLKGSFDELIKIAVKQKKNEETKKK